MYRIETIEDRKVELKSISADGRVIAVSIVAAGKSAQHLGNIQHLPCGHFLSDTPSAVKRGMLRQSAAEIVRLHNRAVKH